LKRPAEQLAGLTQLGSVAKNILTTFYSGNNPVFATISCVASEFLQQSREFGHWLAPQLNLSSSLGWQRMMMESFPDDTEAFARLPQLYEEFLLHQANTLADKELGKKPEIKRDTFYTYDEVATFLC
jgi:hypothetical protein